MKKQIYAAVSILSVVTLASSTNATGAIGKGNTPHLVHSGAHPNNKQYLFATHHFEVHVEGQQLEQLEINIPKGITVKNGVMVKDKSGNEVDAEVTVNKQQLIVTFVRPVSPETILSVDMKGIKTFGDTRIWLYPVSSKSVGLNAYIPLGLVKIHTYRN